MERQAEGRSKSEQVRKLVQLALYDDSTYVDDGPFDEFVRASSARHAFDLRQFFAARGFQAEDAGIIAAALREPGVDAGRAATLILECSQFLRSHNKFWDDTMADIVRDPEPRIRILAIRAGIYAYESAMDDALPAMRIAALELMAGKALRHPVLRRALRDADADVRVTALRYVLVLPEWRDECERLLADPDAKVRTTVHARLAAGLRRQEEQASQRHVPTRET